MERPDVPAALRLIDPSATNGPVDVDHATYFLSESEVHVGSVPVMAPWRKRLYIAMSRVTSEADHLGLPMDRTVIIGVRIEI